MAVETMDGKPCQNCGGRRSRAGGAVPVLVASDVDDVPKVVQEQSLLDGAKQMLKVKGSGEIAKRYQTIRMAACTSCPEQVMERKSGRPTGERLFRKLRGAPHCGTPWFGKLFSKRAPWFEGCGCNLNDKVKWKDAECPRGRWGPGEKFGSGVITVFDNSLEKGRLDGVLDVHVMSRDAPPDITGIGDTLAFLPIVRAIRAANPDKRVRYVVMGATEKWARLGYDDLGSDDDGERTPGEMSIHSSDGTLSALDQVCCENKWSRHHYWEDRFGIVAERLRLAPDVEDRMIAKQALTIALIAGRPVVALSPFSQNLQRTWPRRHWLVLLRLLRKAGVYCYVMDGNNPERTSMFNCKRFLGEPPGLSLALLSLASVYVGNDSGLTHLSALAGTSTVVLSAPSFGEQVYGWYGNVHPIQGDGECSGCYWNHDRGYGVECQSGCDLMWGIRPEVVFETVMDRIELEETEVSL